ncbi:MAG: CBS domain-containing protein [Sphingobium sp.]
MTVSMFLDGSRGPVIHVVVTDSVADVIAVLSQRRIGCVPVVDADDHELVVGIFSERDVIYGLSTRGAGMLDLPVGEVMTSPAETVEPDMPVLAALSLMTRRRIRHLPVVKAGRMVGFISIGDLVKSRIDHIEAEADAMREYIRGA